MPRFAIFSRTDFDGFGIWRTDGTPEGTIRLAESASMAPNPVGTAAHVSDGRLVFTGIGSTPDAGFELWATDGTPGGTGMLKDINPGVQNSFPYLLASLKTGQVLFRADNGSNGFELWTTDGTTAGTTLLRDIAPGLAAGDPAEITPLGNGRAVFRANGYDLWATDGTAAGTVKIAPGTGPTNFDKPQYFVALGGGLAVFNGRGITQGEELYVTDGTAGGTRLLRDIHESGSSDPKFLTAIGGGRVLFQAADQDHGVELWITDGTTGGTRLLKEIAPGRDENGNPFDMIAIGGGKAVFGARTSEEGAELWGTNGTEGGTRLLRDFEPGIGSGFIGNQDPTSNVKFITSLGDGRAIFSAVDAAGREPWITDATPSGTRRLKDIAAGAGGSDPDKFTSLGDGRALFAATDASGARQVWVTDGTPAGTRLLKASLRDPSKMYSFDTGKALVVASEGSRTTLWFTDGTEAGTRDLFPAGGAAQNVGVERFETLITSSLPPNRPPRFDGPLPDRNGREGTPLSFSFSTTAFVDPDGDVLSYAARLASGAALPAWLSFNAATRTFSGTPGFDAAGTLTIRVTANDGRGGTTAADFALRIADTNRPPSPGTPITAPRADEGEAYTLVVPPAAFTDPDLPFGDSLTLSARLGDGSVLPAWLSFNPATRTLSGTPPFDSPATLALRVTATDRAGASANSDFLLRIRNVINGTSNDDTLEAAAGRDNLLRGLAGNDLVFSGDGEDEIDGGPGSDTVSYARAAAGVTVNLSLADFQNTGGAGRDRLISVENLTGSLFADSLLGNSGGNTLRGGDGDDTLAGNAGNDRLFGGSGNDTLLGGTGDDLLDGGTGADRMEGGEGDDLYIVDNSGDVVVEAEGEGVDWVRSAISFRLPLHVENLELTGSRSLNGIGNALDNRILGNAANNVLRGGIGFDRLEGRAGDDTLIGGLGNDDLDGGAGADTMEGNEGDDTYTVDNPGDRVIERFDEGVDTVRSFISYVLPSHLENLILLGDAVIRGTGNALANEITGNGANNVLRGLDGNDTIRGGGGNDTIEGGTGNDSLFGEAGDDILRGGDGDDLLDGGGGNDALVGGPGNDVYVVDSRRDRVIESAGAGTDTVRASISFTLTDHVENLELIGSDPINGTGNALANRLTGNAANNVLNGGAGNDVLDGASGDDTLFGGAGNDDLSGGAGHDRLIGGPGADRKTGGAGNDLFVYRATIDSNRTFGRDTVTDFVVGQDRIDLSAIDGNVDLPGKQGFAFIGAAAFSGPGQVRAFFSGPNTVVQANVDSALGAAELEIVLTGRHVLGAGDFILA